jgi:arylsulfatase A-like enzyme
MSERIEIGARNDSPKSWSLARADALVAGAAVAATSLAELVFWQSKDTTRDLVPLLLATLALAVVCGALGALAAWTGRFRRAFLVLFLAACLWPFVQHGADRVCWHFFRTEAWGAASFVLAPAAAAAFLRAGTSRAGRTILHSSVALLVVSAFWKDHSLTSTGPKAPLGSHPNVIVLVMDTTRRDRFGLYGYGKPTTPNIDALGPTSEVFDRAWTTAPWTPPSHASLFTGELPAESGVDGQACPPFKTKAKALAEVLQDAGYRTGAAVANSILTTPGGGWDRGFDSYLTYWDRSDHTLAPWLNRFRHEPDLFDVEQARAPSTLRLAREWWAASADAPRFLFINLLDPHWPYRPPEEYYRRFLPGIDPARAYSVEQAPEPHHAHPGVSAEDRAILSALYDAELASMDQQIGAFTDWLRQRGELDQTLLVITADHGERLGERGLTGHEVMMDGFLLQIPLLVRYPARVEPRREEALVQLDGVPGYVLQLLGIEAPEPMRSRAIGGSPLDLVVAQNQEPLGFLDQVLKSVPGFNVSPYLGDWAFVSDGHYGWISSTHRGSGPCGLFDLVTDPELTRDLSEALPEVRQRFAARAGTLPHFTPVTRSAIGPSVRKQLKSLGYTGEH